jgi:putative ABC transport system permease protein
MMTNNGNQSPSNNHINHSLDKWLRLFSWFCPAHLYESIEGDLLEQFEIDSGEAGEKRAKRRFIWNVLKFFRPEILFRNSFKFLNLNSHIAMFRNYLIAALRNIKRHKTISFINIFGLAICMFMCLLIGIMVKTNFSYDTLAITQSLLLRSRRNFCQLTHSLKMQ